MKTSLFCDHISVVDIAFLCEQRGLVGASYHLNVEFVGNTDSDGILIDFSKAKKLVKQIVDLYCDHRFVLPEGIAKIDNGRFTLEASFSQNKKQLYYEGPVEAICEIPFSYFTASNLSRHIESLLQEHMHISFDCIKVSLEEDSLSNKAIFNYTHGLKNHDGNCQRLFHGHHNSVDVWVNGEPRPDLEKYLAHEVFRSNIHFCFSDNIVSKDVKPELEGKDYGFVKPGLPVEIKYRGSQGEFRCILPGEMVYITPFETSIENLSSHFATLLKEKSPSNASIKVRAFEGIKKGAISYL